MDAEVSSERTLDPQEFLEKFADHVARRDYRGALAACKERLSTKPDDRYALQMRETVQQYLDTAEDAELIDDDPDGDAVPLLNELHEPAQSAMERGLNALLRYFDDEEHLWAVGEQAVGIFLDVGQLTPWGKRREALLETSKSLTLRLTNRLSAARHGGPLPSFSVAADLGKGEWLFEALGQLWNHYALGLERPAWLVEGCRSEWQGSSMETLVGFSADGLGKAGVGELCDVLIQVWTLERTVVCGLLGDDPPPSLDYGIAAVLAEIRRRPLVEAPIAGFMDSFYLMTHVVYVLNAFNGFLPNRRTDCPWLYAYLERSLWFLLREVKRDLSNVPAAVAASTLASDALDMVAEAVDCLRGLDEGDSEQLCAGITWLLSRQEADDLFYSPAAKRPAATEYDHVHPTWTAAAALQLQREAPSASPYCASWAQYARRQAQKVGFSEAPPLPDLSDV
eukprot:CAMPEP_0172765400 /NCGR_PEP_ID=MMETSP1074-20121228/179180_1 /TAXON_ID=2916 /ORGANISM="Ceratium fusus, Strain PA161109" /LENGTH=451 /DNA_ID=CAMNT_0013600341 /DNA_START=40 /DNA_END=1391 /DNA_ORIENTATION=-